MKYSVKKFLRHIPTGMLMVVGFSLLMFMLFNTLAMLEILDNNGAESKKDSISILIDCEKGEISVADIIHGDGNVYINSECGYISEINCESVVHGLVQYKEEPGRELMIGQYPSENQQSGEPLAVVGYDVYTEATRDGDNRYVTVMGTTYRITGVFSRVSDNIDQSVMVFPALMPDADREEYIRRATDEYTVFICDFEGGTQGYSKSAYRIVELAEELGASATFLEESASAATHVVNEGVSSIKRGATFLVSIFCVFNCFAITNLWMKNREAELSIRKAYGYNVAEIIVLLGKDILKYMGVSVILGYIMQLCYNLYKGTNLINEDIIRDGIDVVILGMVVVTITVLLQIMKVARILPANSVKEVD